VEPDTSEAVHLTQGRTNAEKANHAFLSASATPRENRNYDAFKLRAICKKLLAFIPAETLRSYLMGDEQKNLFAFLLQPGGHLQIIARNNPSGTW
jgi:hypothetical protein